MTAGAVVLRADLTDSSLATLERVDGHGRERGAPESERDARRETERGGADDARNGTMRRAGRDARTHAHSELRPLKKVLK